MFAYKYTIIYNHTRTFPQEKSKKGLLFSIKGLTLQA